MVFFFFLIPSILLKDVFCLTTLHLLSHFIGFEYFRTTEAASVSVTVWSARSDTVCLPFSLFSGKL